MQGSKTIQQFSVCSCIENYCADLYYDCSFVDQLLTFFRVTCKMRRKFNEDIIFSQRKNNIERFPSVKPFLKFQICFHQLKYPPPWQPLKGWQYLNEDIYHISKNFPSLHNTKEIEVINLE